MRRRLAALGLAVATAAALSGCMRFEADLTVKHDNTVDGSYVVAIEEGVGAGMGGTDREVAEGLLADSGLETTFTRQWAHAYAADGYSGIELEFRDEPLASFAPTDDRFGITRDGDEFVVSGKAASTEADAAVDSGENPEMTVSIAFPGPVSSSNGTAHGNTVTWNLVGGPPVLEARASAIATHSPWPGIAATTLVLAVAALTFWPRTPKPARRPGQPTRRRTTASGGKAARPR